MTNDLIENYLTTCKAPATDRPTSDPEDVASSNSFSSCLLREPKCPLPTFQAEKRPKVTCSYLVFDL